VTSVPPTHTGSVSLADLVSHLEEFLEVAEFEDYGPNGLQVEGKRTIHKIVTGVSACADLFARAEEARADAVIVHHGLFWNNLSPVLTGAHYRRIAELIRTETSLLAYHLPLDAHPEVGNNALAAAELGLESLEPFGTAKGRPIGCRGAWAEPLPVEALAARCRAAFRQEPLLLGETARPVRTVAVVSGGAQNLLHEAIAAGVDAFVTGEASEWVTHLAQETGTCFVSAGHHATERLGIRALGEHLRQRWGVDVEFVDIPNPV
jgi:dinuclear metal center YbgI/SA1388 family protein